MKSCEDLIAIHRFVLDCKSGNAEADVRSECVDLIYWLHNPGVAGDPDTLYAKIREALAGLRIALPKHYLLVFFGTHIIQIYVGEYLILVALDLGLKEMDEIDKIAHKKEAIRDYLRKLISKGENVSV